MDFNIKSLLEYVYKVKIDCPELEEVIIKRSKTGMPRYVLSRNGERLFTLRPHDFLPTLSPSSAKMLAKCLPGKSGKVYVSEQPTKTVFNKHVIDADPNILRGIDVLVIHEGELVAFGKSVVSGVEMVKINFGEAVKVRGKLG